MHHVVKVLDLVLVSWLLGDRRSLFDLNLDSELIANFACITDDVKHIVVYCIVFIVNHVLMC